AASIIGLPFSLASYAYFTEAIFLALYLFARDRMGPWMHWAMLLPVCLGALVSAWIVVAANAWMNAPTGFKLHNGRFVDVSPLHAVFNAAMPSETFHMIAAAYLATGFAVAGVYAVSMLRGRRGTYERRGLGLGMFLVALAIIPIGISGDNAGRMIA